MPIPSPYLVTRHETVALDEERAVAGVLGMVTGQMNELYPPGTPALRDEKKAA